MGSLEQQLQERAAELAVQRTATLAAEQRAVALDAALQQANSATVSMASKIAQTMSDANGQVSRQPGCAPFPVC